MRQDTVTHTFQLPEGDVSFSLSSLAVVVVVVEGYERVDCECVHPSISKASNNGASPCVCPRPPVVPVSASLLSQLILIYGLTLFPAG